MKARIGEIINLIHRLNNSSSEAGCDEGLAVVDSTVLTELIDKVLCIELVEPETNNALHATQTALSQAVQHADAMQGFVARVARLSIWGCDRNDEGITQPGDGYEDSHACLMAHIVEARALLGDAFEVQNDELTV